MGLSDRWLYPRVSLSWLNLLEAFGVCSVAVGLVLAMKSAGSVEKSGRDAMATRFACFVNFRCR